MGAGDMVKKTDLAEDLSLIPSTYIAGLTISCNSSTQRFSVSSLQGHLHTWVHSHTETYMHT